MHWYECNGVEGKTCQPIKKVNVGFVLNVTIFMILKKGIQKPESAVARVLKIFLIPGAVRNVKSSR
jgi:hypothetical protein